MNLHRKSFSKMRLGAYEFFVLKQLQIDFSVFQLHLVKLGLFINQRPLKLQKFALSAVKIELDLYAMAGSTHNKSITFQTCRSTSLDLVPEFLKP